MSNTIDEKVVEMRFDNRDFEKNVKDTMKTLDEFKKQLNFSGASDGLENIAQHANKLNFNNLSNAIDTVNERFSTLGIMGVTALQNITNSAINAGKRIVDSLTIAPVRSGYEEYELTLNTIKTVMNATNKSADEVKRQLKSLDDYADKTIYSTGDMFNNISKFTNVGVPLEDASTAMIGIANATALAGRGAREASIAMYNLGQAIGVGYLNRIDYKSLQNAGIDTNEWKEAMIDAAVAAGTLTKTQDGMYKSGKKLFTMQNLFIDGLQTQWATRDVMMKVLTDYGNQETDIGKKAWKAAQEVRTFSGMMEALKASVGTGWKETWDLIFGDLDQATSFWTRINDFVSGIIGGFTKKRNEFLQGVLNPISPLLEKIGDSANAIKETVNSVKDYVTVVDEIIQGKWGNGQKRFDALAKAGYDWAHAQNLVNEKLGNSKRLATDFSESQDGLNKTEEKIIDTTGKYIQSLSEMDDATLLSTLGDQEKVDAVREIQRQADRLGLTVSELVDRSDELSGRTLIIESLANIGSSLIKIFESIGKAWKEAFPPITTDTVYDIIAGLYKFSNIIKNYVEENADKLTRTFKGLFAVLSVVANLVKGALKIAFTAFKSIMGVFGKTTSGVLDVTASLGDILVFISKIINDRIIKVVNTIIYIMENGIGVVKKAILNNKTLVSVFETVKNTLSNGIKSIKDYVKNNEKLNNAIKTVKDNITKLTDKIRKWFEETDIVGTVTTTLKEKIEKVSKAVKDWYENNEKLKETFSKVKTKIDESKKSLDEWYHSFDEEGGLGKHIKNKLTSGIEKMLENMSPVIERLKKNFGILKETLSNNIKSIGEYITNNVKLNEAINTLKNNIDTLINTIKTWFEENTVINNIITTLKENIEKISQAISDWYNNNEKLKETFETIKNKIDEAKKSLQEWYNSLDDNNIAKRIIDGLANGLMYGIEKVKNAVIAVANKIKETFCKIFNINSPSKVFFEYGQYIVEGLINGIKSLFPSIEKIWNNILEVFGKFNFGDIANVLLRATNLIPQLGFLQLPMKLFYLFSACGVNSINGFKAGLEKNGGLFKTIQNLANKVIETFNKIFHIESPSKVFMAIGGFIMAGLAIGLKNGFKKIPDTIQGFGKKIIEAFKKINFGKITALFMAGGLFFITYELTKSLGAIGKAISGLSNIATNVTSPLKGLGDALTGIGNMFTDKGKAERTKARGEAVRNIAISIALLAASIFVISKINKDDLWRSVGVIAILTVVMTALFAFVTWFDTKFTVESKGFTLFKSGKSISPLLTIAASILLMAIAIKAISKIDLGDNTIKTFGILAAVLLSFSAMLLVASKAGANAEKAGVMLLSISIAMLLIVKIINKINELSPIELSKGLIVMTLISGIFTALIIVSSVAGKFSKKSGSMILKIVSSIALMVLVIKMISKISDKDLFRGLAVISIFSIIFTNLIAVSSLITKSNKGIGGILLSVSASIFIMIGAIKLLTSISNGDLARGLLVIGVLALIFKSIIKISSYSGANAAKAGVMLLGMSAALLVVVGALFLLTQIDDENLWRSVGIIAILEALFAGLIYVSKYAGEAKDTILSLSIAIAVLVGALVVLTFIDQEKLRSAAISLGVVIAALGFALGMTNKLPSVGKSIAAILSMTVAIIAIGVMLKLMDNINGDNAIKNALSISAVLLAMGVVLKILSSIQNIGMKSLGAMAILGLVVAEIGLVFFMLKKLDVQPSLEAAEALSVLLLAMSVSLVILSTIGATAKVAIAGAGALVAVVTIFIAAITALGAFFKEVDNMEQYLDKGGQILIKIGDILGQFIGSLLVGIAKPLMDYLPEMSEKLSQFMIRLVPFITISKLIDEDMFKHIKILTISIIALTAAELIQGIADFLNIGRSLEDFGKDLGNFMINALPFFVALKLLGPEVLTSTKILAEAMIAITAAELVQGLTSFLTFGKSNLEKFSEELPFLADGINGFIARLTDVSAEKLEIVKTAVEAIKAIADLASYDLGTVATNIGSFGEQLIIFGSRMNGFFGILSNIGLDTIQAGIDKVNNLVNLASNVASINVEQVSAFSNSLVEIATKGVIGFCDAFQNFEPKDKVRLATVAMIGAAILGAEETLPKLVNKFKTACSDILTHISSQYEAMKGVGVYFTEGFKIGIEQGTGPVVEAARKMASDAVIAAKEAIDSSSPSKETMKLGNYFGSGFAIGIKDYFGKVYDTAYTSGDLAKEGLSNAISKISSIIEDGIDTNPTIRPVLDLSDVEAGASNLSSMLGTNSIGLNTNLNSISNGFNSRIQNGGSDILSAIKNLETTILTKCGNTTNIYTQELDSAKLDQIVAHVNREFGIMY